MGLAGHSVFNNYQELYYEVLKLGVVNVKTTGTLLFDTPVNIHGTAATPITTNLAIDPTNALEDATVEVIFSGAVNPNITGVPAADILNIGETITTQGTYSIFIIYTGGKYKVNIQSPTAYVGDGDGLGDPDVPPTNTPALVTNLQATVSEITGLTPALVTNLQATVDDIGVPALVTNLAAAVADI